jgi:hypothetical protein
LSRLFGCRAAQRFRGIFDAADVMAKPCHWRRREMNVRSRLTLAGLIATTLLFAPSAQAAEKAEKEKEAPAELELGMAVEWAIPGGGVGVGPSVGIEYTVFKDWLEVELEVSPLFGGGRTDWDTELIFKKPFELSEKLEVMPGVGPAWLYSVSHGQSSSSLGAVAMLDFQFWPTPARNFGWFIEPSYTYDLGREHEQSLGVTFGLLIPIR